MKIQRVFHFLSFVVVLLLMLAILPSAKYATTKKKILPLSSIHIVDRNGFSETISNKDRLDQYQQTNFFESQPYQKVLRIFARDTKGNVRSVVNTYHENGNPKQFLEILNGRANGMYQEWHENGVLSLSTKVIGGQADVTQQAEKTWLFDGLSQAWDDEAHLIGEITYSQGSLNGVSIYYHSNGQIWKRIPYYNNLVNGTAEVYKSNGELLQRTTYINGIQQGQCQRFWHPEQLAAQEEYVNDKLLSGQYFDQCGNIVAEIKEGNGYKAIFGKEHVKETQEYRCGQLEGEVKVFNSEGRLKRIYHVKNDIKNGEEIEYYDSLCESSLQPKLAFYWKEGQIQGIVKTWYPSGTQESQKEISKNKKNGVFTAWYRDGSLMMIEEYEDDHLIRGEYLRKGDRIPVSEVSHGKGTVTIFDPDGHFVQKIPYINSKPDK